MNFIVGAASLLRLTLGRVLQLAAEIFGFDANKSTFVPNTAKRNGGGPFAAGILNQGRVSNASYSDEIYVSGGTKIDRQFATTGDAYQGTIVFWFTPEWNGNDGVEHRILTNTAVGSLWKTASNTLQFYRFSPSITATGPSTTSWTAGTTYCIIIRWDTKHGFDNSGNHVVFTVNGNYTYAQATTWEPDANPGVWWLGDYYGMISANGLIEGLTVYRRCLYDGYGVDVGNGHELNAIYNSGSGKDPCEITGSWDVVLCVPTNASVGALTTGTGNAWTHPHSSNVLQQWNMSDGYYGGGEWAVGFNGTNTKIDCGSDAALDNLPTADFTVDFWVKFASITSTTDRIIGKRVDTTHRWFIGTDADKIYLYVYFDTTAVTYKVSHGFGVGKWGHVVMAWDATAKVARYAFNGVWQSASSAGVGTYGSDASANLFLGCDGSTAYLEGGLAWVRISNTASRYTPGINFVPSRQPPAIDANTIGQWNMAEGTGTTIDNAEGTAARDGTLANGTWIRQWVDVGTPVGATSLVFDGASTRINCGSDSTVDDLLVNDFTIEGWFRPSIDATGTWVVAEKGTSSNTGWRVIMGSSGIGAYVYGTGGNMNWNSAIRGGIQNNRWHHLVWRWVASQKTIYFAADGVWSLYGVMAGTPVSDAASTLYLGATNGASGFYKGAMGWVRLSTARYTPWINFTPPSRTVLPANDASTIRLFYMNEGLGTTVVDYSSNAQNGTITGGTWVALTRDSEVDAIGEGPYRSGYRFVSDAANEGISQTLSGLTAGANYVIRPVVTPADGATPIIRVLDATNGDAVITSLAMPSTTTNVITNGEFETDLTGWTAGASVATVVAGGASGNCVSIANQYNNINGNVRTGAIQLVPNGRYVFSYYHKDGTSKGYAYVGTSLGGNQLVNAPNLVDATWVSRSHVFTAPSNGIVYVGLNCQSNTINDTTLFDSVSLVRDFAAGAPFCEPFSFELPTVARNGVAADCTAIKVQVLNTAASGVVGVHQVELLPNLIDNPSLDVGSGDPWLPSGWTNEGLDATDTVDETTVVHSSGHAVRFNTGASAERILTAITAASSRYLAYGCWFRGDDSFQTVQFKDAYNYLKSQAAATDISLGLKAPAWTELKGVARASLANPAIALYAQGSAVGPRYADDLYAILLDDISLNVSTPSKTNSTASTGLRVDGRDTLSQPVEKLTATSGIVRWKMTPRHSAADVAKFGEATPYIMDLYGDANNWIRLYWSAANRIALDVKCPGFAQTWLWDATGSIVAGTTYACELEYNSSGIYFKVDGTTRTRILTSGIPANWWSGAVAAYQPKGAASLAASLVNLANPGTYDAAAGVLPAWSSGTGWTGGSNAYLTTGILAGSDWTYVVKFSGGTGSGDQALIGSRGTWPYLHEIFHVTSAKSYFNWGAQYDVGSIVSSGVLAMARNLFYRDGYYLGNSTATAPVITNATYLMASNAAGSPSYRFTGSIQAIGIYNRALSASEVADVSSALVAIDTPINLTTMPTTVYWGHKQDGTSQYDAAFDSPTI